MSSETSQTRAKRNRKVFIYAFLGALSILAAIKVAVQYWPTSSALPIEPGRPTLLFVTMREPCVCMRQLIGRANTQIVMWPKERQGNVKIIYLDFGVDPSLEARYKIFRAPALVLLDGQEKIIWRQDYPLIEGEPFELEELEKAIVEIENK